MTFSDIHKKVFEIVSKDIDIPVENIFYIFPPEDKLSNFPRIHFRTENVKSISLGDDTEFLTEFRLVVDIYSYKPIFEIADNIVKNAFNHYSELEASVDNYYQEDKIYGKQLVFNIKFINN